MNTPHASLAPIATDTYRISVAMPPEVFPGGFSFNQYLVVDERPLLFHTGPKKFFALVCEQIEKVLPVAQLRYIAFSHVEADECGSLAEFFLDKALVHDIPDRSRRAVYIACLARVRYAVTYENLE